MIADTQALVDGLRQSPAILAALVQSIPEDKLDVRRGDGFWTIAEHVSHLAQVQPMLRDRLKRFLAEEHPTFVPYLPGEGEDEPDTPVRLPMDVALAQFGEIREEQCRLLDNADANRWNRQGTHPEYDQYSLHILTRHLLMHDHWHMYRVEELWLTRDAYLTRLE